MAAVELLVACFVDADDADCHYHCQCHCMSLVCRWYVVGMSLRRMFYLYSLLRDVRQCDVMSQMVP